MDAYRQILHLWVNRFWSELATGHHTPAKNKTWNHKQTAAGLKPLQIRDVIDRRSVGTKRLMMYLP